MSWCVVGVLIWGVIGVHLAECKRMGIQTAPSRQLQAFDIWRTRDQEDMRMDGIYLYAGPGERLIRMHELHS